ncbi:uncharacterized protein LOC123207964 [Mangifera indica]|uniref:uncharacterized protein LOC123207964 n=1 Tax=Mangifera indica TaxID=29780 RepID=UPI001CFB4F2B|nr:uncharacterized protein LOC123207964 [Mangifera indica]
MARAGIPRAKISMLSSWKEAREVDRRCLSNTAVAFDDDRHQTQDKNLTGTTSWSGEKKSSSSSYWVPHPRTGIYFPQGQEWVMDDVPKGAASFVQAYWLRTEDGVEKPDPDHGHHHHWDSSCFHASS